MLFQDLHWRYKRGEGMGRGGNIESLSGHDEHMYENQFKQKKRPPKRRKEQRASRSIFSFLLILTYTKTISAPIILATLELFNPTILPTAQCPVPSMRTISLAWTTLAVAVSTSFN